jgi:hypothetical protein
VLPNFGLDEYVAVGMTFGGGGFTVVVGVRLLLGSDVTGDTGAELCSGSVTGGTVTAGEAGALELFSAAGTAEGGVVEALAVQAERRATATIAATTDLIGDPRIE